MSLAAARMRAQATAPTCPYEVTDAHGVVSMLSNPAQMPEPHHVKQVRMPPLAIVRTRVPL
jgi:translation elongation factor EF-4